VTKPKNSTRNVVRHRATDDSRWTEARDKQLKDLLVNVGLSASEAANRLGITKNAVCGRAARLGILYGRTAKKERESRKNFVAPPKPRKRIASAVPVEGMKDVARREAEPKPIGKMATPPDDGACRWVHGDPATPTWQHCGHPQQEQSVYCPHHHSRAYHRVPHKGNVVPLKLGIRRR
jgi:GcrA cell cycle regulator